MPKFMVDPKLLSDEPTWEAIQAIAEEFSVMPMAAAVRYADLTRQPVMAVFSDGGRVWWWRENRPRTEGLWLESKQELSEESVVFHQARGENEDHALTAVPWHA